MATEGVGSNGKYLLIEVPNYNLATTPVTALGSYLRLGAVKDLSLAANPQAPKASGEDLASQITDFIDDTRVREGCPGYIPPAVRQAETALLHTKGGWRDHSDGNRITTTRGDKVEVIKGNYKMVVLGRADDEATIDISGGHIGENGITYAGGSTIEYSTEFYGGTWVVVENTIKGHVHTAYHGMTYDYFCGEVVESITGSEAPSAQQPNPVVTNKTWAESMYSATGSAALMVPLSVSETWVETSTDTTTVITQSSTTMAQTMTSETTAVAISDTTTAETMTSMTTAGMTDDTTIAGMTVSTSIVGLSSSTTIGVQEDLSIGATMSTIIGPEVEIIIGMENEATIGASNSLTMGIENSINMSQSASIKMGLEESLSLSAALSVVLGITIDVAIGVAVNVSATLDINITPLSIDVDAEKFIL